MTNEISLDLQQKTFEEWQDLLITLFCKLFPEEKNKMEECKHSYNNDINKYHVENSVWTHTMMVCIASKCHHYNNKIYLKECFSEIMITLLHDYGKVETRIMDHEKCVTHFRGHAYKSVSFAYKVILKIIEKLFLPSTFFEEIDTILYTISRHMDYDNVKNEDDLNKFSNFSYKFFENMYYFSIYDFLGRITDDSRKWTGRDHYLKLTENLIGTPESIPLINEKENSSNNIVNIFCGLPGSGKDYWAKKFNSEHILSFDDIRIELYENYGPFKKSDISYIEKYKKAYEFCKQNDYDFNKILSDKLKNIKLKNNEINKISICNTNLNKKARTSIINLVKNVFKDDVKINIIFIIATLDYCIKNDFTRSLYNDKLIDEPVIKSLNSIVFPTFNENMDNIYILYPEINFMTRNIKDAFYFISSET